MSGTFCKEYNIGRDTVLEYSAKRKYFTYEGLAIDIEKRGGLPQISPGKNLDQYLESFVCRGVLKIEGSSTQSVSESSMFSVPFNIKNKSN